MNLLDENVREDQRSLLRTWGLPIQQIGSDVGRRGMKQEFSTKSKRMGAVLRVSHTAVSVWRRNAPIAKRLHW
jgi:hypothetical protein